MKGIILYQSKYGATKKYAQWLSERTGFYCRGAWDMEEWYPTEGQKHMANGSAMLEVYSPDDMRSPDYECGIWVPIRKSAAQDEQEAAEVVSTMTVTGIL